MADIIVERHSFSPFIPGASVPNYTEEELKELNAKEKETFSYEDKEYTPYEAMQHQREIERNIRQLKRELICYKETGLEEDFKIASNKALYVKRISSDPKKNSLRINFINTLISINTFK